jgi:hypothetical protein
MVPVFLSQACAQALPSTTQDLGLMRCRTPALEAQLKNGLNTGLTKATVYRLDENFDPVCLSGAINFQEPSDDGFIWAGNLLLLRRPGLQSNDPDGFDKDGKGGIFAMNGRIRYEDISFTIESYKGKTPIDVCALLAA